MHTKRKSLILAPSTVHTNLTHQLAGLFFISLFRSTLRRWSCSVLYAHYVFCVLHLSRFQRKSAILLALTIHRNHCRHHHLSILSINDWHTLLNHNVDVKQPKLVWVMDLFCFFSLVPLLLSESLFVTFFFWNFF